MVLAHNGGSKFFFPKKEGCFTGYFMSPCQALKFKSDDTARLCLSGENKSIELYTSKYLDCTTIQPILYTADEKQMNEQWLRKQFVCPQFLRIL